MGESSAAAFFSSARLDQQNTDAIYGPKPSADAIVLSMQMNELDTTNILQLIKKKVDVNLADTTFGWSPLHFAVNTGNVVAVKTLIEAKASVKTKCNQRNTPLHFAARNGHDGICRYLVTKKCRVDARNGLGYTPLFWSCITGHARAVSSLVDARSDVNAVDADGCTACMHAARNGHADVLQTLLAQGLDLAKRDPFGLTAADHARDHLEMRRYLLVQEGLNQNLLDAVVRNDVEAAREAIQAGAAVQGADDAGWSALTWAMMNKSIEMVRLLALANADITDGGAAIEDLDLGEHRQDLEQALEHGLGAQARLFEAARRGDWQAVEEHLDMGSRLDAREGETSFSCLMHAVTQSNCPAACMLIARKAPPEQREVSGWTALHFAVQSRNIEMVSKLASQSCDVSAVTHDGYTAQHVAARADDAAMVQLLFAAKCGLDAKSLDGQTPLQTAVQWSSVEAANAIICLGGDVAEQDDMGHSMFGLACMRGHTPMVMALLEPLQPLPSVCDDDWLEAQDGREQGLDLVREAQRLSVRMQPDPAEVAKPAAKRRPSAGAAQPRAGRRKQKDEAAVAPQAAAAPPAAGQPLMRVQEELDRQGLDGFTPLTLATFHGQAHLISTLLDLKAPLDAPDSTGTTALMHAAAQGSYVAADVLLCAGADERIENNDAETALDLASTDALRDRIQRAALLRHVPGRAVSVQMKTSVVGEHDGSSAHEEAGHSAVYRVRVEGLPVLAPTELVKQLVEEKLGQVLLNDEPLEAVRIEMPDDLIVVGKPRGFAYIDFATEEEAEAFLAAFRPRRGRARGRVPQGPQAQAGVRLVRLGKRYLSPEEFASEQDDGFHEEERVSE